MPYNQDEEWNLSPLIETDRLTKRFDKLVAVDSLTLAVAQGQVLALLGPNGAGKTTTVRMLSSILKPTGGSARIAGWDVATQAERVRHVVGHLTETPGLYSRMSAQDYLDFFGELQGMRPAERQARSAELLKHFGLWEERGRRLGEFSKGMRQKIALIRAMLHNPRVLFLDEPTSAMDPQSAKQVRDAIATLRGSGHTIVLCTHNLFEAESLADCLALVRRGRLVALGTPAELKRRWLGPSSWLVRLAQPLGQAWPDLEGALDIQEAGELALRYHTPTPETTNPRLLEHLHQTHAQVIELSQVPQSLEQVYLKLVQSEEA